MMSNSRIPSPARSLGVSSPRRYILRRSRSVCSPGRLQTSTRLSAMIPEEFVVSPLPNRRSVLNDNTEIIDVPTRKSWWRQLDENSRDVMELLDHKEVAEGNNIEENFDVEILSQEKKNYTLDLPDSSDGESISSIVIPQRKLFTQKENHPPKKFPLVFKNREELGKLQKSHVDHDEEIDVRPKTLFNQAKKPKTKPIFPSALLNLSSNKTIANKTKEMPNVEPKGQVRNLFGNKAGTKRKNMFADFLVSESEDEVPEIQAKVFGFQKKSEQKRRVSNARVENSPTASILDVDIDEWKQLPSSTMMENQIEALAATPSKRTRLSRVTEPEESTNMNKSLNKSRRNESLRSNKSKLTSSPPNIGENVETNSSKVDKANQSKTLNKNKTQSDAQSSKLGKTYDKNEPTGVQDEADLDKNSFHEKERDNDSTKTTKETKDCQGDQEEMQDESDGENNFTLEYENEEDNLEQVEEGPEENINQSSSNKILKEYQNRTLTAKVQKDETLKNKSNTTLPKDKNVNVSIAQNKSMANNVSKERVEDNLHLNVSGNNDRNKSLVEENNTTKNNSEQQINKTASNLEISGTLNDNESSKESTKDISEEVDQNEDSSEESIQLDESENHNESLENENIDEPENNEIINESEKETSNSNEDKIEQVIDKVNKPETDNVNKSNKNTEKSKHNETQVDPPEAIMFQQSKNFIESFTVKDGDNSPRKTKSMFKNNLRPSLAPVRESTGFSDNTGNSSGANSGWDSHRTTRKTLRKTFGKDFTPRKSLRTLVMEKSAKQRQTFNPDLQDISKHPRANSTELPGHDVNEPQDEMDNENNEMQVEVNNVIIKETPDGTENDIGDDHNMEAAENDNISERKEDSEVVDSHLQPEGSENENVEGSDNESKENSEEESDHDIDATVNQQTEEESDHANVSANQETDEESDHNDTSNRQTENDSDGDASMNEDTENREVEETNEVQEDSDDDRDNEELEESANIDVSENNAQDSYNTAVEESNHDFSRRMRQTTLELYLEKIKKQELERKNKLRESLMHNLKTPKDTHTFKVPSIPMRRKVKPVQKKVKTAPAKAMEVDDLPEEVIKDFKYKPPRRYQPKNASWATMRLYKYLETKLEPKYDYMARVRAEKLVTTLHEFTRLVRRHDVAPSHMVAALKQEMARLKVVDTHYEFYNFFHEFMPREIRVKVNPDIVNRIQLPKDVFSNIIK